MRENLFNARKKHNLTQQELARQIGITTRHYNSLEAGTSYGSVKIWQELKRILHAKSIDWLLEQTDDHLSPTE